MCRECARHDVFFTSFADELHNWGTWQDYWEVFAIQRLWARRRSTQPTGVTFVTGEGGTVEALDSIASFVKSQIPTPPGHRDSIDSLLHDAQHPLPWASSPDNLGEIRRTFLAGNRHFTM